VENKVVFLRGKKTILRPYCEESDLARMVRWINDPEVTRFITAFRPMTPQIEKESLERLSNSDKNMFLVIEVEDGTPIGSVGLHGIDWVNRSATSGAMIGEKDYWGKGYGTDAKMALLNFAFNRLNLKTIKSAAISFNVRSQKALLKQGYREVGRMPQLHFRDGRFHDEVLFILTRKDFMRVWRVYNTKGESR
jgi:RimJ/RimL family protein N-acetyltransferase